LWLEFVSATERVIQEATAMWAIFTVATMEYVSTQWFLPLGLLIDYSLFVYLLVVYWNRRREPRVKLLLSVRLLSAAILVP
jgi:hypothetical protein